ncbi:Noc4p [Rhizophagus irregularis DAOM 197198w]|uniref:Noc4p n=1 Tax=Rhizophagus irregularis (strain DAOM 197198w) TaxID=1432141 RepID=A0A015MV04_RHIIW|nr:Noc4p [Rhizophagus irregularis DAOM 197198w]
MQSSELEQIKDLEQRISVSKSNYNNIVTLLEYTKDKSPKVIHSALYALYRTFSPLLSKGELQKPKNENLERDKKGLIKIWLRDNYVQYVNTLCNFLRHEEPGLQIPSLNILLNLLKIESTYLTSASGSHQFSNNHYYHVVEGLIDNENFSEPLKTEFVEKYWNTYDDLRFYFLKNASLDEKSVDKLNSLMENTFSILENLRTMPTDASEIDEFWTGHPAPGTRLSYTLDFSELSNSQENDDCEDDSDNMLFDDLFNENFEKEQTKESQKEIPHKKTKKPVLLQLSAHKRVFSDCWLALMKLPMTQESYKRILLIMHKKIIPHMPQPTLLMDYLTESYNAGGVTSILALNGLFTLINEYNLDYPDFYKKLYTLFDRNLMHVKYRSRFFRLADLFLASTIYKKNVPTFINSSATWYSNDNTYDLQLD